jgi:hypothetical protein
MVDALSERVSLVSDETAIIDAGTPSKVGITVSWNTSEWELTGDRVLTSFFIDLIDLLSDRSNHLGHAILIATGQQLNESSASLTMLNQVIEDGTIGSNDQRW